ncbi:translesion error-prone DNA polymerase V autoproteolytic subunit [Acinetobacter sp. VNK23]|uniref:LexA family protein n=1 Tax=Acinetobacter thutiue TaxID=2998078 RepID=UPI0025758921|nr:translesion error-prone DNA polymerase V autoproteolytic subunit [Acinetobacter thutiue]MDM1021567.1 translesion error-prone DNA polymerase V autoproteolytic subunit [Acinetobacter thutiue]
MSKKLPIYFSDGAWSSLQTLMGPEGKPSPTLNAVLEQIAIQTDLIDKLGLTQFLPKSKAAIPVALERIPAGPAFATKDEQEKSLDLNEFLIHNPISTFIAYVDSESMLGAGLEVNDPIIIDRSIEAKHNDIVVALIDNKDSTIKRLMITSKMSKSEIKEIFGDENHHLPKLWLKAENPAYEHIIPSDSQTIVVWGVVTFNLKRIYHRS